MTLAYSLPTNPTKTTDDIVKDIILLIVLHAAVYSAWIAVGYVEIDFPPPMQDPVYVYLDEV